MYSPGGERKLHLAEDKKEVALKFFWEVHSRTQLQWRLMNKKHFAQSQLSLPHAGDIVITAVASFCSGEAPSTTVHSPRQLLMPWFQMDGFPALWDIHVDEQHVESLHLKLWSGRKSLLLHVCPSCPFCGQCCLVGFSWKPTLAPDAGKLRPGLLVPVHTHCWPVCSCPSGEAD